MEKGVCDNCSKLDIKIVDETIERCVVPIDDECFIIFSYETNEVLKNFTFYVLEKTREWLILSEYCLVQLFQTVS